MRVYTDNTESLGSINDLLIDNSEIVNAVVRGVGGFLGTGEHLVAVPLHAVKFVNQPLASTGSGSSGAPGAGASINRPAAPSTTTGSTSTAASPKPNPWYPDHAVFNANTDLLKAMPDFGYSEQRFAADTT